MTVKIYTTDGSVLVGHAPYDTVAAALEAAVASGTNLEAAHLADAVLEKAHLPSALLSRAMLQGANMKEAQLCRAVLTFADLTKVNLCYADLTFAFLCASDLTKAQLAGANLERARLSGATFTGANLSGADLSGADLSGTDLSGANLINARLEGVRLRGTNLDGATIAKGIKLVGHDAIVYIGPVVHGRSLFAFNTNRGIFYRCADYFGQGIGLSRSVADWFADEPDSVAQVNAFKKALESLDERVQIWRTAPKPPFSEEELEKLRLLNQRLTDLEIWLRQQAADIEPTLIESANAPEDPLSDYLIDAEISYYMREDDPDWSEEYNDPLAERDFFLTRLEDDDYAANFNDLPEKAYPEFQGEHHCWLFHDLYGHGNPPLPLRECLRVGKVVVDIKLIRQYSLDVESGKWT